MITLIIAYPHMVCGSVIELVLTLTSSTSPSLFTQDKVEELEQEITGYAISLLEIGLR